MNLNQETKLSIIIFIAVYAYFYHFDIMYLENNIGMMPVWGGLIYVLTSGYLK